MKVDRFAKTVVLLNCTVPVALLGWDAWGGQLGANPVNFAIWPAPRFLVHLIRETAFNIQIRIYEYHFVRRWILLRSQAALNSLGVA